MSAQRRKAQRGLTLIEIMVAMGVSAVVIAAASASIMAMIKLNRDSSRKSDIDLQSRLAMVYLERNLANAGLNLPVSRVAFRMRNNIAEGSTITNGAAFGSGLGGETLLDVVAEGPDTSTAGIIAGTDVVEIAWSDPLRHRVGRVTDCAGPGGVCVQAGTSDGAVVLLTANPFRVTVNPPWDETQEIRDHAGLPNGPLLMFTNAPQADPASLNTCLARATNFDALTNTVTLKFMDLDLAEATPTLCPAVGMMVYAIDGRQRFMIYRDGVNPVPGLYVQAADTNSLVPRQVFLAPTLLASGVEDMQVSPQIWNPASTGNPTELCGDATKPVCSCNREPEAPEVEVASPACSVGVADVAGWSGVQSTPQFAEQSVRAALVYLSTRSAATNAMDIRGMNFRRWHAFDRADDGTPDEHFRQGFQLSVWFPNTMVNQL